MVAHISAVTFCLRVFQYPGEEGSDTPEALLLCADLEGSGLASDRPVSGSVRAPLRLRAPHLDHQGQGESFQETVCGLRQREVAAHRQLHRIQLQPPSPAVSMSTDHTHSYSHYHPPQL